MSKEVNILLKRVKKGINPESIEEYKKEGGFQALEKILKEGDKDKFIEEIKISGLRGRGGAGFPTGLKWEMAKKLESPKYIICNADEGEPGTFKDKILMENDPFSIVEAMIIAAFLTNTDKGYIYIRGEYPLSIQRIRNAISESYKNKYLGDNILNSNFKFDLEVFEGAGAYLCGEETALIESIEGKRGHPRVKPPFPTVKGLWNRPTIVNNVETFANILPIILNGGEWYKKIGPEKSPGPKIYTISGKINKPGYYELPMGITLRELIYDVAGGIKDNKRFKVAQVGGATGALLGEDLLDLPLDFVSLREKNLPLGSGAVLVLDETVDIKGFFYSLTNFYRHESCGKCAPCRLGTTYFYKMAKKIVNGKLSNEEWNKLVDLSIYMNDSSYCPLGQSLKNPVLGFDKYLKQELNLT